jgi:hypothetical protein
MTGLRGRENTRWVLLYLSSGCDLKKPPQLFKSEDQNHNTLLMEIRFGGTTPPVLVYPKEHVASSDFLRFCVMFAAIFTSPLGSSIDLYVPGSP